jgi:hypothetical protein
MPGTRDRIYTIGPVTINRHPVEWNNLAWNTLRRVTGMTELPLLGEESEEFAVVAKFFLKDITCPEWCYANPAFTALAPADTPEAEFLAVVKRLQLDWLGQYRSLFARAGSVQRERKRLKRDGVHPLVWRLSVTGILLHNNSQRQLRLA